MLRYVRKDCRVYQFSLCKLCGTAGACGEHGCDTVTCLWCGTPQCSSNGASRGQCAICYHGFLLSWSSSNSGQPCAYKGCKDPAVGRFPRKGKACAKHGEHILGSRYLVNRMVERDAYWVPVEASR